MGRKSLAPGLRFHPTDVELVLYYLKRKVLGKKLHYEAIAEVNIYKFSPWDLPDKSCLKSQDLEWFFFCPREKKYASGVRVNRATENGFWKTTGKDRTILCDEKTVGTVKTLIFHLGHAPKGERTDWVIHEYRILDDQLAEAGVQDTYALCKVFKKNGPGPRNGAQYGAPFNESDWADDADDAENHGISMASNAPSPDMLMQTEEQSLPVERGLLGLGSPSPSAGGPTSVVVADKNDHEIVRLLASFTDEDVLLSNENGIDQDDLSCKEKNEALPSSDGHDIYNGLGDLDSWGQTNNDSHFSGWQNNEYFLNNMLPQDNLTYIELDDLWPPLDCCNGVNGAGQSSLCETIGSHSHENMQQFNSGASFSGIDQYAWCSNELSVPLEGSYEDNSLDVLQMVDYLNYQGSNASYDLDFTFEQLESMVYLPSNMERGSHIKNCYSRFMEGNPAHLPSAPSFSSTGGSSIHIKAEVTHGAGECTNEALSRMMGGSGSCWFNLPCAVFPKLQLSVVNHLICLVQFGYYLISVYCHLNWTISWSYYFYYLNENPVFTLTTTCGNLINHISLKSFLVLFLNKYEAPPPLQQKNRSFLYFPSGR